MVENLFRNVPNRLSDELIQTLVDDKNVRIERIVSTGHVTKEDFWYDQDEQEWVVILKGEAKLSFKGDPEPIHLAVGDHLLIPAHQQHRVEWTSQREPTVWLAIFFPS